MRLHRERSPIFAAAVTGKPIQLLWHRLHGGYLEVRGLSLLTVRHWPFEP